MTDQCDGVCQHVADGLAIFLLFNEGEWVPVDRESDSDVLWLLTTKLPGAVNGLNNLMADGCRRRVRARNLKRALDAQGRLQPSPSCGPDQDLAALRDLWKIGFVGIFRMVRFHFVGIVAVAGFRDIVLPQP